MDIMTFLGTLYDVNGEGDENYYDDLDIEGHHGEAECAKEMVTCDINEI